MGNQQSTKHVVGLEKAKIVSMTHKQVTEIASIPIEVEELNLEGNDLRAFPNIKENKVRVLTMTRNKNLFTQFPTHFEQFVHLEKLMLQKCGIGNTLPECLWKFDKLTYLDLSDNEDIQKINCMYPENVVLTTMLWDNCCQKEFPFEILEFGDLVELSMSRNPLLTFSNVNFHMECKLKRLNFSRCELSSIPSIISKMKHLERLWLNFNRFQKFKMEEYHFERLTHLNLSCNEISELSGLETLGSLVFLDVSANQLTSFSCKLELLQELKVTRNNLSEIDVDCRKLVDLQCSENPLKKCQIRGNSISNLDIKRCHLDKIILETPNLTTLDCSYNSFESIEWLKDLLFLTSLIMTNCHVTDASFLPRSLTKIVLEVNLFKDLASFSEFKHVEELNLRSNQVSSLEGISQMERLRTGLFDQNRLVDIPCTEILSMNSLNYLFCNDNGIWKIPMQIDDAITHKKTKCVFYFGGSRPNEIFPNLFLGDYRSAKNYPLALELGFTHVLTVAKGLPPLFPDMLTYKIIEIDDVPSSNLLKEFDECISYIEECHSKKGTILVHCAAGISRSASVVIAYAMKHEKMTFEDAWNHVQTKRPIICPNPGFRKQLAEYQATLK